MALATVQRATLSDRLLLWLALLQGSSLTLSLALNGGFGPRAELATLVAVVWALMYLYAALALFVVFGLDWASWLARYRLPLTLLVAGASLSALWSIAPALSVERGAHLVGTTLVALYLGLRFPLEDMLRTTARALALLLALSALAALFVPALGIEDYQGREVWRGVTDSKNTLGFWSAVGVMLFGARALDARTLDVRIGHAVLLALALLCLARSVSATSVLALVLAALAVLYVHAMRAFRLPTVSAALLGALVLGLAALAFRSIDTAEMIGRSDDLTGRGEVWAQTWRLILERPLTGWGYGALWFPVDESLWIQRTLLDIRWTVYHAHNGLLHIASEIGLPLTALAVAFVAQLLIEILWCHERQPRVAALFVLGFAVALAASNYSEARLLGNRDLYWTLLIALPLALLRESAPLGSPVAAPPRGGWRTLSARRGRLAYRRELKRRLRARRLAVAGAPDPNVVAEQDGAERASGSPPEATAGGAVSRRPAAGRS